MKYLTFPCIIQDVYTDEDKVFCTSKLTTTYFPWADLNAIFLWVRVCAYTNINICIFIISISNLFELIIKKVGKNQIAAHEK